MTENRPSGAYPEFLSTLRPPAFGTGGAVASPHYLATQAGQEIVKNGGHAVDAAIAMNTVLCVVYPHMAGLGGDLFSLIWDKDKEKVEAINGSGKSGEEVTLDYFKSKDYEEIPSRGPLSANTVPGTVDAWWEMHQRYGKAEWKSLFTKAIHYAEHGFPLSSKFSEFVYDKRDVLEQYNESKKHFIKDGKFPSEGDLFKQADLANSLKLISENGPSVFYEGEIADKIISSLRKHGGLLTKNDLQNHKSEWQEPLRSSYRDYEVYQVRPNTQGLASLIILNILEEFDVKKIGDNTADYYHLMAEATKLAFLYRDEWVTDENHMDKKPEELIAKDIARELARQIKFDSLSPALERTKELPLFKENRDTTYMCAVDGEGNSCSLIQSVYHEFGSGFIPEECGFLLQNRGSFFSLDPEHPNRLEPGKKTFHTIIPAMMLKNGKPYMVYGSMGGEGQPQTQAALVTRVVDFGYNIQQAIEAPRWLHGKTWGEDSKTFKLESRIPRSITEELKKRGQLVERVENWTGTMGHAQGIIIDGERGVLSAGADPRGDGIGLSW
ncbi:gamma-glutamyltransferase [Planococcus salinus]|uniref:Glutathione hydrolase proenzyme n=1 Tax=Planococcus salinus TaxID=1848460 RepID=A0A3M8P8Y7_9BACL|nr:gamma-glutamyltransferase [Planococcus salinus]RNF40169.1 gamma-glutamyltransferase [Planococcus salinus]